MNRAEKLAIDYVLRCHDDMVTASKGPGLKALEAQEFISFIKIAYEAGYYMRELNESLDAIKAIFPQRQTMLAASGEEC